MNWSLKVVIHLEIILAGKVKYKDLFPLKLIESIEFNATVFAAACLMHASSCC